MRLKSTNFLFRSHQCVDDAEAAKEAGQVVLIVKLLKIKDMA
jgi:hypothetical protein